MTRHHLKTWTEPFRATKSGLKPYELRLNDRDYKVGDTLILEEYYPHDGSYTGDHLEKIVTYILGEPFVQKGYVIMSVIDVDVNDSISLKRMNGLTPIIESCTMKLIEELGELLQIIGKGNQMSGELPRLKTGERNPLRLIEEAFDVAQSAVTMIYTVADKWEISVDEQRMLHEKKLVEKGYMLNV